MQMPNYRRRAAGGSGVRAKKIFPQKNAKAALCFAIRVVRRFFTYAHLLRPPPVPRESCSRPAGETTIYCTRLDPPPLTSVYNTALHAAFLYSFFPLRRRISAGSRAVIRQLSGLQVSGEGGGADFQNFSRHSRIIFF